MLGKVKVMVLHIALLFWGMLSIIVGLDEMVQVSITLGGCDWMDDGVLQSCCLSLLGLVVASWRSAQNYVYLQEYQVTWWWFLCDFKFNLDYDRFFLFLLWKWKSFGCDLLLFTIHMHQMFSLFFSSFFKVKIVFSSVRWLIPCMI